MASNDLEFEISEDLSQLTVSKTYHIPPDGEGAFQLFATPKELIRKGRAHISGGCACCAKVAQNGQELKRCSKCKMVWYCSQDCQKKDWPLHKAICKENSSNIHKILTSFMANPFLVAFLQVAFASQFNLAEDSEVLKFIDKPFIARCEVSIHPTDKAFMLKLATGTISKEELEKGCEGMLQLKSFIPLNFEKDGTKAVRALRLEIWKEAKRRVVKDGEPYTPVALVDFVLRGEKVGIPFAVEISEDSGAAMLAGRGITYHDVRAGHEFTTKIQPDVEMCLDAINFHIYLDKKDQLRLRSHLNKKDIEKLQKSHERSGSQRSK